MGDRANVVVIDRYTQDRHPKEAVFLYSHWGGHELPEVLRSALQRGVGRWDDESYLARIVFNELTKGDEMSETGHGISTRLTDNEYPLLVLVDQVVYAVPESHYEEHGLVDFEGHPQIPFAEYVLEERSWESFEKATVG